MTAYRIYIVDARGRLRLGEAFEAADDVAAIAHILAVTPKGQVAELWDQGRLVGQIGKDHGFTPNA